MYNQHAVAIVGLSDGLKQRCSKGFPPTSLLYRLLSRVPLTYSFYIEFGKYDFDNSNCIFYFRAQVLA